ncbi:hypothetical protein [Parahalioglobus pacificus]|uniref:Uncharacterized protein n=1 Tax=Parahalioglobus pacificus TaxID=930806 RepID=A0A918XGM2_9GAMM|nr:hypothetical protein [Halioglobus pacificus]GHD30866.1 hypothetical protein GCM10007053_13100 [Halioglobus pacificus]
MSQAEIKRPLFVWVIFLFTMFSAAFMAIGSYFAFSSSTGEMTELTGYVDSLGFIDWALMALTTVLNLAGTIFLFRLKVIAVPLLTFAFLLGIASSIWEIAANNYIEELQSVGPGAVEGALLGAVISTAIVAYSWHLKNKNILS